MSHNALNSLATRCNRHCGTITIYEDKGQSVERIRATFLSFLHNQDNILHYYFIIHDDTERKHIHFILIFATTYRLGTTLNKLSAYLNLDTTQIGIEKLTNLNAYLRYFLHLEEEVDKKRYDIMDIVSDENLTRLQDYIDTDDEVISSTRLISLVLTYANEVDIMNYLGLTTYHKYRYEIKLLYENMTYLALHYKHLIPEKKLDNDLPF